MPVSRKRKHKKKKPENKPARKMTQPFSEEKIETIDGLKVTRRGNMTYTENIRTEEQQKLFLENLNKNYPKLTEYINELANSVLAIFEKYDNIALLAALSYNHYLKQEDRADDGLSEVMLEHGMGIASSRKPNPYLPLPTGKVLNNLIDLFAEIRQLTLDYYVGEAIIAKGELAVSKEAITDIRLSVITELLTIRGTGYFDQVESSFLEMFSPHNEFFVLFCKWVLIKTDQYLFPLADHLLLFFNDRAVLPLAPDMLLEIQMNSRDDLTGELCAYLNKISYSRYKEFRDATLAQAKVELVSGGPNFFLRTAYST